MYHSLLSLKMISFVLFPQASQPSMNLSISELVYYETQGEGGTSTKSAFVSMGQSLQLMSTGIFENQVSKHFVISLNFPCLSLFTALFAYVSSFFWLFRCFMVRNLRRGGCRQNFTNFFLSFFLSLPPSLVFFHPYPQFSLYSSHSYLKSAHA